jgi:hypothetical protein
MGCCLDAQTDAIVAERAGVLTFARAFAGQIGALVGMGRIGADEATLLKHQIRAFADAIATGLHRDGADPVAVRNAMRLIVKGES